MVLVLLVLFAWVTALVPMPWWLSLIATVIVMFIGSVFLLFGLFFNYWDSYMTPGSHPSMPGLAAGILMLLSRAAWIAKLVFRAID